MHDDCDGEVTAHGGAARRSQQDPDGGLLRAAAAHKRQCLVEVDIEVRRQERSVFEFEAATGELAESPAQNSDRLGVLGFIGPSNGRSGLHGNGFRDGRRGR